MTFLHFPGHVITHMAAWSSGKLLATGAGSFIRLWRADAGQNSLFSLISRSPLDLRVTEEWQEDKILSWSKDVYNRDPSEVVITGMHWLSAHELAISYREHGVQ